ncbi:hypothetical protein ACS0TY_000921 [Phlomoides rotata]
MDSSVSCCHSGGQAVLPLLVQLWNLWYSQNSLVFEQSLFSYSQIRDYSWRMVDNFFSAQLNSNASIRPGRGTGVPRLRGFAEILKGVVWCYAERCSIALNVDMAEETTVFRVLNIALEQGVPKKAMKKAMRPSKGFTVSEVGQNLFSFHFCYVDDMTDLGVGKQPSAVSPYLATFWTRLYDLLTSARNQKNIRAIASPRGEVIEIDTASLNGINRSVRVKIRVDIGKPLKQEIKLAQKNDTYLWVPIKYERLPSFCFICGMLGHMRRECDLADDERDIQSLPDNILPFGDWMRASPYKKTSVSTMGISGN